MTSPTKKDRVFEIIAQERERQESSLSMIPSENYCSSEVMEAVGSEMMWKYSEGQVDKRYYQGNRFMDEVEALAKERALKAFGLEEEEYGVNVQALSGSPANLGVYNGLLEPGDKIMAMYLPHGGHLSHGWMYKGNKTTLVSKVWEVEYYMVDKDTEVFDYDAIEKQAKKYKPKMLISGGTAYPREIDHERMGKIAKEVGAYYLADIAHEAGLVAAGVNGNPFPHADVVTFTTHKTLRGPRGAVILSKRKLSREVDRGIFPGLQGGPHNHTIAGIAVALRETMEEAFAEYAGQVVKNAQTLAEVFSQADLHVVSGGTDKHLVLLDLRGSEADAWVVAHALEEAGIVANYNTVPYDTGSPMYPSGLRLGSPALTTRGMKEKEMRQIGEWFLQVIKHCSQWRLPEEKEARKHFVRGIESTLEGDDVLEGIRSEVRELTAAFPLK